MNLSDPASCRQARSQSQGEALVSGMLSWVADILVLKREGYRNYRRTPSNKKIGPIHIFLEELVRVVCLFLPFTNIL